MEDGLNPNRRQRIAELLDAFRSTQYQITSVAVDPPAAEYENDYYTEGYAVLRQCFLDGAHILGIGADMSVSASGGERTELKKYLLDAYARRHEGIKIGCRQEAVGRWLERREGFVVMAAAGQDVGFRTVAEALGACDCQLRADLALITDQCVYNALRDQDMACGKWIDEDPSLREVVWWLRSRRRVH